VSGSAGRSTPPIGTPPAVATATGSGSEATLSPKPQPAKKRNVMRGPDVAYTSRRFIAAKIASRVFSSAQTAASPPDVWNCRMDW
jgi:hypothetical protein